MWSLVLWVLCLALPGCGIYSFTGTNISPDVKTVSIQTFVDRSGGGPPNLSQTFSEKARDYFQRNSGLSVIGKDGDLQLEGAITGYQLSPVNTSASEVAEQTRLTITVQVKYINLKDETQNFENSFSFFADFPRSANLSTVEAGLIDQISDQIILDIFNKTVANW